MLLSLLSFFFLCLSARSLLLLLFESKGFIGKAIDAALFLLFLLLGALALLNSNFGLTTLFLGGSALFLLLTAYSLVRRLLYQKRASFLTKMACTLPLLLFYSTEMALTSLYRFTQDRPLLQVQMTGKSIQKWVEWQAPDHPAEKRALAAYEVVIKDMEGKTLAAHYLIGEQIGIKAKVIRFIPLLNHLGIENACKLDSLSSDYFTAEMQNQMPKQAFILTTPISWVQNLLWSSWSSLYFQKSSSWWVKSASNQSIYFPLVDSKGAAFRGSFVLTANMAGLSNL